MTNQTSALRPDVLLNQGVFRWRSRHEEEQSELNEALQALLGQDFGQDQDSDNW